MKDYTLDSRKKGKYIVSCKEEDGKYKITFADGTKFVIDVNEENFYKINDRLERQSETALKNYDDVTSKEVFIEAANGDRVAKEILNTSLTYLGITVANIITTFDPEKVVIGGGVINGGDIVLETVKEEVAKRCMKVFVDSCSIEKAKLGGQAGVLGAAALAIME